MFKDDQNKQNSVIDKIWKCWIEEKFRKFISYCHYSKHKILFCTLYGFDLIFFIRKG